MPTGTSARQLRMFHAIGLVCANLSPGQDLPKHRVPRIIYSLAHSAHWQASIRHNMPSRVIPHRSLNHTYQTLKLGVLIIKSIPLVELRH